MLWTSERRFKVTLLRAVAVVSLGALCGVAGAAEKVVPIDTVPLTGDGDFASEMVDGIDRFLLRKIDEAQERRDETWQLDLSSPAALQQSLAPHREKLAHILGVRDPRLPFAAPALLAEPATPAAVASHETYDVYAISWPVLGDPAPQLQGLPSLVAEGLLLVPRGKPAGDAPLANVIVLPDADQTPEQWCGLIPGVPAASQVARSLAESGCRVIVPHLISRQREKRLGRANLTHREYLHRPAFELGRTLAGYEVQSVLSLVDWLHQERPEQSVGLFGYGEGGMLALFAAGLDERIGSVCVSGFFGPRSASWTEPVDRNFFGLLKHFDAAELATLVAPRRLVIETAMGPELTLAGEGGAPAELRSPDPAAAADMLQRAKARLSAQNGAAPAENFLLVNPPGGEFGTDEALRLMLAGLGLNRDGTLAGGAQAIGGVSDDDTAAAEDAAAKREQRLVRRIDRHNQALLSESHFVREQFLSKLDTSSLDAYQASVESYREIFRDEVIGHFDEPLLPPAAKLRQTWETPKWTGYEVQLDVFPDVFAYGALLLPKDLQPGQRRPVVVCQHGLEGRPTDTFLENHRAYHDFAAALCERGFIVFAPQNPYIFEDRFRTLQRKAQPLGKTLFSIIVPQHQQIVNWLKDQPFTDPQRIAFYGLSYGGKSAMRIPPLVTDYCLSICSADFNEWVLKNASTRHRFSYVWTGEYEIYEWDLGSTFNYAEMAALICPRPFMVERGHFDGVGEDHWVALEYAKVRYLYAAKLGIADRTEIEWFVGPHTINGKKTFAFLHRHLNWPEPHAERSEPKSSQNDPAGDGS